MSDVTLILGTPANSALIGDLNWAADLQALGDEGFVIRSVRIDKNPVTVIAANTEIGALCGNGVSCQAKHLVYLGTLWQEFMESDTCAKGRNSTVAKVLAGQVQPARLTGMVSVTNPGLDTNWCGVIFRKRTGTPLAGWRGIRICPPRALPMNGRA